MFKVQGMIACLLALLLCLLASCARAEAVVGKDVAIEDITDFYYTYETPYAVSVYQRYRFYVEDGRKLLFHESRQGGAWPQTEEDTVCTGTVVLTEDDWSAFFECLRGGTVDRRSDDALSGDDGPWTYLYWTGDGGEVQEYAFPSAKSRLAFEALCSRLAGNHILTRFRFTRGGYTIPRTFEVALSRGGYRVMDDDEESHPLDPALAEELQQVVKACDLEAWDGFHGSNPHVLDGESFSLELLFADGSMVYASGENRFPKGYYDAVDRIESIWERERMARVAGTYRWGGITVALDADGSYADSEGDLTGTWHEYDGAVYLYGNAEIMFGVENGRLIYLRTDASPFPRAKVPDRATFTRLGGGM